MLCDCKRLPSASAIVVSFAIGVAAAFGAESTPEGSARAKAETGPGRSELLDYWQARPLPPARYVAGAFRRARWVFVGEYHRIRHDAELIGSLVPLLHETTDVRHLALEFLCRDRTEEANRLVTADRFDRAQAIDFFREQFPGWSYEEYLAIFRETWESNRSRAAERGAFRLVGLNPCPDWETIHYGEDPQAVRAEQAKQDRYDELMAEALETRLLRPGIRALIFTGIAHATGKFTEYRNGTDQPLPRMGNLVYHEPYRSDMFFIALHAPFYDAAAGREIYPFDAVLDELMAAYGEDIGFNVVGTPFASLVHRERSPHSITAYTFGELYDGYVMFHTPIKRYEGVTCIDDWVTDESELRQLARNLPNPRASAEFAELSLEEFRRDHCAPRPDHGAEFKRRFRELPDLVTVRDP